MNTTHNFIAFDKLQECEQIPVLPGIISNELRSYFNLYVMGVASASISILGLVTNVINAVVFHRQGLNDGVTLSLFSLTISDLSAAFCTFFNGLFFIAYETHFLRKVVDWTSVMYVVTGWSRSMFLDISMLTTVFISVERCLLIVFPLHFKGGMTVSKTGRILTFVYFFIISCYMPVYVTQGLSWKYDPFLNETRLSSWLGQSRTSIEIFSNTLNGITIPSLSYIIVIASAYIMIRSLRASAKFRSQSTLGNKEASTHNGGKDSQHSVTERKVKRSTLTNRDRRVIKLVCLVAAVFILCTFPQVVIIYAQRFIPEFEFHGRFQNFHNTLAAFVFFVGGINASANMFIYLSASSKYKNVFLDIFLRDEK